MPLAINQGDYVYYTDTSVGDPTGWDWYFLGGSPTGSNFQNPIIQYLSPSSNLGYPVTLNISRGPLTSTATDSNAIIVLPENVYLEINAFPNPSSIDMSTSVSYQITLPPPSPISYYRWVIPGATGFSGGIGYTGPANELTQTINVDDWYTVTGTYAGSTYSTYTTFATVYAYTFFGNIGSSSVQVTFNKNGPDETFNFAEQNLYDPLTVYYTASPTPYLTPVAGLPGNGPVLSFTEGSQEFLNTKFRGHGEVIYYSTSNMDLSSLPPASFGILPLMYVASGAGLNNLGVPFSGWENLPRYTIGQYMLAGDISTFFNDTAYLGDGFGNLSALSQPPRYWTPNQISSIIFETSMASQTSKSLELFTTYQPLASIFGEDGYMGLSGGMGGCCLPAFNLCGAPVTLFLNLEYSPGGQIQSIDPGLTVTIPVVVSDSLINGGNGNSPDGRLVLAQDTSGGTGFASMIQSELDDYFINVLGHPTNDFVKAEASPDYAYKYASSSYDVNVFNGLKITIMRNDPSDPLNPGIPPYLVRITLSDNFSTFPLPTYNQTKAFGTSGVSPGNWTCFAYDYVANPAQLYRPDLPFPYRGFTYGPVPY